MNPFFGQPRPFEVPPRVYARTIDADGLRYVLFDAVEAAWFDEVHADYAADLTPAVWRELIDRAPIYAIEVNSRNGTEQPALSFLENNRFPRWVEIDNIEPDPAGPGEIYNTIAGAPQRIRFKPKPMRSAARKAIKQATDISGHIQSDASIRARLPSAALDQVFVLDVGQGGANALVDDHGDVVAYVDLGAGVLADAGTWPTAMTGICLAHTPVVILTHWHYDHFEAANKYPNAKTMTWIAPLQTLGPGPQSAMASDVIANGTLVVWNGTGNLTTGAIELERCNGPSGNQNRTGIAVWINGPNAGDPILLPGDAGYSDIASLRGGGTARLITSLVVSHHGGNAPGRPPADPGLSVTRAALSFGKANSYTHPLAHSLTALRGAHWSIGPVPGTPIDDRRTEDRTGGLGHIRLAWPGSKTSTRSCHCACSIDPTQ